MANKFLIDHKKSNLALPVDNPKKYHDTIKGVKKKDISQSKFNPNKGIQPGLKQS
jgi:hypothetical protein